MVRLKSVGNFLKAMDPLSYELVLPWRFSIFQRLFVFRDWLRVIVIASIKGSIKFIGSEIKRNRHLSIK